MEKLLKQWENTSPLVVLFSRHVIPQLRAIKSQIKPEGERKSLSLQLGSLTEENLSKKSLDSSLVSTSDISC